MTKISSLLLPAEPLPEARASATLWRERLDAVAARSQFRGEDGAGLRLYLPDAGWTGQLCVLTPGSGVYRDLDSVYMGEGKPCPGKLLPLGEYAFVEGLGANLYAELLLSRGHAVAWVRKDEIRPPGGVCQADLEDGTRARVSHHSNLAYTLAMIEFAQHEIQARLAAPPELTLLYGHSSGAMTARLVNIRPEANIAANGSHIVDGVIADDAGGGMYLPDDQPMDGRVPQVDITRLLYQPTVSGALKRLNAERLVRAGAPHRHYGVQSVSHFDAGMSGRPHALDLGGFLAAVWDMMERWCTGTGDPPASQQVLLPQAACPLGERSAPRNGPLTDFEPFQGVTAHWRRLGLLTPGEVFLIAGWRARLVEVAHALTEAGLFSAEAVRWTEANAEQIFRDAGVRP